MQTLLLRKLKIICSLKARKIFAMLGFALIAINTTLSQPTWVATYPNITDATALNCNLNVNLTNLTGDVTVYYIFWRFPRVSPNTDVKAWALDPSSAPLYPSTMLGGGSYTYSLADDGTVITTFFGDLLPNKPTNQVNVTVEYGAGLLTPTVGPQFANPACPSIGLFVNIGTGDPCVNQDAYADFNYFLTGTALVDCEWNIDWGDGNVSNFISSVQNETPPIDWEYHPYTSADSCGYAPAFTVVNPGLCATVGDENYTTSFEMHGRDIVDDGNAQMLVNEILITAGDAGPIYLCEGKEYTLRFQDASTWNCQPPVPLLGGLAGIPNLDQRNVQWLYGVDNTGTIQNTITDPVQIVSEPADATQVVGVKGDTIPVAAPTNTSSQIIIPASCVDGQEFRVYLNNWNYCNPLGDATYGDPVWDEIQIIIIDAPDAPSVDDEEYCYDGTPAASYPMIVNSPDGSFTYDWYSDALLSNHIVTATSYDPGTSIPSDGTYTYYVAASNANCQGPATTVTLTVNEAITGNEIGADEDICNGTLPSQLTEITPAAGGNGSYTYEWQYKPASSGSYATAPGVATGINYTPGVTPETTEFRRVVTSGGCSNISDFVTVTVFTPVSVNITTSPASMCSEDTYTIEGTITGGITTGDWSASGNGVFGASGNLSTTYTPGTDDYTAETVTLTLTSDDPAGPCPAESDNEVIPVVRAVAVDVRTDDAMCTSDVTYSITGTTADNYSGLDWNTSGTGGFSDEGIENPVYTPSPADISSGSVVLTLTATANGPCTDKNDFFTLTINVQPAADAGLGGTICSTGSFQLAATITGDNTGILWTSDGDGSFDDDAIEDPIYTPGPTDQAGSTVRLTADVTATAVCANVDDFVDIIVNPEATVEAGSAQTICSDESATLAGSFAGGATSASWTGGAGTYVPNANAVDAVYTPSAGEITAGTVTLILTTNDPAGPCPSVNDNVTITINPEATVEAGPAQTICSDVSATLAGSFAGGATSANWTGGGGSYAPNANAVNAVYTPSAGEITAGTVTLTLTTNNPTGPCPAVNDNVTITINPEATVEAGPAQTICSDESATLAGSFAGGATSASWTGGAGTYVPNANAVDAVYTPSAGEITAGTVTLTLTTNDPAGPCPDVNDFVIITINPEATVEAGPAQTICSDVSATLAGSFAGGATSASWTGGAGTYVPNANAVDAVYTPSAGEITAGTVTLTLTTNNPTGPCPAVNDNVTITNPLCY
jgi:hypothetical protein